MSEGGADSPRPQLGPRDEGYHPRQESQQPDVAPQTTPTEVTHPTTPAPEQPSLRGIIKRFTTSVGRKIADKVSATPEPKLLPDQVSPQTVAQRMMKSRDDRTLIGFSERAELQWMGYITTPKHDSPDYPQWMAVSQGVRKANAELISAGILEQGLVDTPSGEKEIAYRVKDPAKLAQLAESKPVMQAHPR